LSVSLQELVDNTVSKIDVFWVIVKLYLLTHSCFCCFLDWKKWIYYSDTCVRCCRLPPWERDKASRSNPMPRMRLSHHVQETNKTSYPFVTSSLLPYTLCL